VGHFDYICGCNDCAITSLQGLAFLPLYNHYRTEAFHIWFKFVLLFDSRPKSEIQDTVSALHLTCFEMMIE
jgi:hypothetical protein